MPKTDLPFNPADYALVAERILLFFERYPSGRIITDLISRSKDEITFKATVFRASTPCEPPAATGWASEKPGDGDINAVACLENTETSAIGRGLANLGFTASRKRPSYEEMLKAGRARADRAATPLTAVREAAPRVVNEELQAHANAISDVLALLPIAERLGMRAARAERIRRRLRELPPPIESVEEVHRALRIWIERRELPPKPGRL